MSPLYDFSDERRFERSGYALSIYRMTPRASSRQ
jgi:hypothetical protein